MVYPAVPVVEITINLTAGAGTRVYVGTTASVTFGVIASPFDASRNTGDQGTQHKAPGFVDDVGVMNDTGPVNMNAREGLSAKSTWAIVVRTLVPFMLIGAIVALVSSCCNAGESSSLL